MSFSNNTAEKVEPELVKRESINKTGILMLNVAYSSLDKISNIISEMLEVILEAKKTREYSICNFKFNELRKKIDEVSQNTNINSDYMLLGKNELVVDKMKSLDESLIKPEYGIDDMLIDDGAYQKMIQFKYDDVSKSFTVENYVNGFFEEMKMYDSTQLTHKAFNRLGVGVVFNENFHKFKEAFADRDAISNKSYAIKVSDALLSIYGVKIVDVNGYVGDLKNLDIRLKANKNLLEDGYFILEAEAGDFQSPFYLNRFIEGKETEIILKRDVQIESNKIRTDSIHISLRTEINLFDQHMNTGSINMKIIKLNEIRYTLFFYQDKFPFLIDFTSHKDDQKMIQVDLNPVTVETLNLKPETLYSEREIEAALWRVMSALNFVNSEKYRIETILALEPSF